MLFLRVIAWYGAEKISLKKSCFYLYIRRDTFGLWSASTTGQRSYVYDKGTTYASHCKTRAASLTAGLSGAIVEIVSGLYFWMYRETSKQLGKYHKRLEATEKYLIALQIIEMLPEENRNEQYGKLIDYIFENVNKQ